MSKANQQKQFGYKEPQSGLYGAVLKKMNKINTQEPPPPEEHDEEPDFGNDPELGNIPGTTSYDVMKMRRFANTDAAKRALTYGQNDRQNLLDYFHTKMAAQRGGMTSDDYTQDMEQALRDEKFNEEYTPLEKLDMQFDADTFAPYPPQRVLFF